MPRRDLVDTGQPFPFRRVDGAGIFEITVGPVHAGIIEPGHFRFSVEGEEIVNLETRLGFTHKGDGEALRAAPARAHARAGGADLRRRAWRTRWPTPRPLERLTGCVVPPRAAWLRVALLELERLYNHVGDVGMIVNDTGFSWGHAHCFRLREELLRLNERLTGHRLMRGAVVPGGIAGPLADATLGEAVATVERLTAEFLEIARLCLGNTMVLERLQGTGRLSLQIARELGVVGLAARAAASMSTSAGTLRSRPTPSSG